MGNKTKRNPRAREQNRPSIFFIVALLVGLAFIVWAAVVVIRQPMKPVAPAKPAGKTSTLSLPDKKAGVAAGLRS